MKRYLQNINEHYSRFCLGIADLIMGLYISSHMNYLDNPSITPPPPIRGAELAATGFADDWWFSLIFMSVGIIMLASVILNTKKLSNLALYINTGLFTMISTSFFIRGVIDSRFNVTWVLSLLVVALTIGIAKGGDDDLK
ncbi:hypothetical protein [Apilactobacillus timberlakei]|uniref:Uncharacterized protein n=1 Tax=Apilactobacillus timberlakei TaxID=2008380 RepID=A0ABY2YRF1_9LACO|nr:hypothetical protein [Apilactobacillus timberlakei]TPR12793.1 hypothetical protein DY048_07220 [Apilactobacillus timberlakei]TPR13676.1 hypothetical protein DY052_08090 [Apilactobacillus timberlakei]